MNTVASVAAASLRTWVVVSPKLECSRVHDVIKPFGMQMMLSAIIKAAVRMTMHVLYMRITVLCLSHFVVSVVRLVDENGIPTFSVGTTFRTV